MAPFLGPDPELPTTLPHGSGRSPSHDLPPRLQSTGLNVLIAGCGLSGLVAAIECWRKGHTITRILERNSGPLLSGDMVTIGPSATRIFRHWPQIWREVEAEQYDCATSYKKHTGEHIYGPSPPTFNDPEHLVGREGPGPNVGFVQSRVKFYNSLLRQAIRLGIEITYDCKVRDYFEDEAQGKAGVITEQGQVYLADIVVAADGISTRSGRVVGNEHVQPRESGMAVYRCAYPVELALQDPTVNTRWPRKQGEQPLWEFWMGKGVHVVVCLSDDLVCWGVTHPDDGSAREEWDPQTSPMDVINVLERQASGWNEAIPALIKTAPAGSVVHWKLMWRDLRREWTSPGGRVVQIGDSAHSFLPASGNGATQALEDAVTLAACLHVSGKSQAHVATKVYNLLRYQRISCAQKMGFINAQTKHQTDWKAIEEEPSRIRTRFPVWVFKHDAEGYAYEKYSQAFDHLINGAPFKNTNLPSGHKFKSWTMDEINADIKNGRTADELLTGDWS